MFLTKIQIFLNLPELQYGVIAIPHICDLMPRMALLAKLNGL